MRDQHHRHIVIGYAEQNVLTFIVTKIGISASLDQHFGYDWVGNIEQSGLAIMVLTSLSFCS